MRCIVSFISFILLFASCSGEVVEEIIGTGDNVVVGNWDHFYKDTDSLVLTRIFTFDQYSYFSFAEGKTQNELNKQSYLITYTELILSKYIQEYILINDTLWIMNSHKDQITKYIRQKPKIPESEGY
ncbi:MAG: hypothetical protein RL662_1432 [Bacteroidota bacterium]|jgi:hypothetical protein